MRGPHEEDPFPPWWKGDCMLESNPDFYRKRVEIIGTRQETVNVVLALALTVYRIQNLGV
jgi:hypothetical protein